MPIWLFYYNAIGKTGLEGNSGITGEAISQEKFNTISCETSRDTPINCTINCFHRWQTPPLSWNFSLESYVML